MKKISVISGLFFTMMILVSWSIINNSSSPCDAPLVGGHTGAPGETSCSGCHAGTDNSGPATITCGIVGGVSQYTPGQVYSLTVSIAQSSINKMGFSCLALKNSNTTTIGNFQLTDAVRTRTYADGARNYISHKPCAADVTTIGFNEWTFDWKAPATNEGNITLYFGLLASNHNHATSGDFAYTRSITISPALSTNLSDLDPSEISFDVFPNPTSDKFTIKTKTAKQIIKITNAQGKVIKVINSELEAYHNPPSYSAKELSLSKGIYFISLSNGINQSVKKLIIN